MSKKYLGSLLIAIAGIMFWILIMPAYNHVVALRTALEEREEILRHRTQIMSNISTLTKSYSDRSADLERFSYIVPRQKNSAELVSTLQALASQNGLVLTSIALGAANSQSKTPYETQSIDIGLSGSYLSFRSFLDALEQNIRIMDVVTMDINQTSDNSPVLGLRIKANAYYLKNDDTTE